jgi:antitoxin component YwqK of YwqJK toxin-antitoxin module
MIIKQILVATLLATSLNIFAQSDKKIKSTKVNHIVSIQANQLIRQIFNFSNNNPTINNPYLLTYSATSKKLNWGIDAGLGYVYSNIFDNDGNTKRETFINELNARFGIQKMIPLTQKFSAQFSVHAVYDLVDNKTKTEIRNDFQSGQTTITITKNDIVRIGGGPALGIRYQLNQKISIGTECNYYFKSGKTKSKTTIENIFQGVPQFFDEVKNDNDLSTFIFNVPAAIFLQIQF